MIIKKCESCGEIVDISTHFGNCPEEWVLVVSNGEYGKIKRKDIPKGHIKVKNKEELKKFLRKVV
jgi:hypothetical protein